MKLLLTSNGFSNKSIANALKELAGKDFSELKLVFIPTAANIEDEDKQWLIEDLENCRKLGFKSIDIVEIDALPAKISLKRIENVDVIMFGGGDCFYLRDWIIKTRLAKELPRLLETRVYVGISSGSMVTNPELNFKDLRELFFGYWKDVAPKKERGLGLVNFLIRPHLNDEYFQNMNINYLEKQVKNYKYPLYALDDNSAVKVDSDKIEVVSEGEWKKFN